MVPETKQMTIPELIDAIVPYIRKERYSDCYISGLKQCFNQFEKYCAEQKITQLTAETVQQFLWLNNRIRLILYQNGKNS